MKYLIVHKIQSKIVISEDNRKAAAMREMRCKRKLSSTTSADVNPMMFFKVYLPDRSSHQLQLPSALVNLLNFAFFPKSILVCFGKRTWPVDVEDVGDTLAFQNGWSDFVQNSSLEAGDLMVFNYLGAARFNVKIYGKNGCERNNAYALRKCKIGREDHEIEPHDQYEHTNQRGEEMNSSEDEEQSTFEDSDYHYESEGVSNENQKKKSRKGKSTSDKKRPRGLTKPKHRIWNGAGNKNKVPDVPYTSVYPHFKMGVLPVYISRASLNVPMPFARKYMKPGKVTTTLQAFDKSWPVTLTTYTNGCCKISKGWLAFLRDNCVKVKDICVFELIDLNVYTFKVTIFHP